MPHCTDSSSTSATRTNSASFVRTSKFRHVYGTAYKKEMFYEDLKIGHGVNDSSNICQVNPHYIAVNWDSACGGSFAVIPVAATGRLPTDYPLVRGHAGTVLDVDFSPFDDQVVASCAEDSCIMVWKIGTADFTRSSPDESPVSCVRTVRGHHRKVTNIRFHPLASNVLTSTSTDQTLRIWDVERGKDVIQTAPFPDAISSFAYSFDGLSIGSTGKDKRIRLIDCRTGQITSEANGHDGVKNCRLQWMGDTSYFVTTGFSRCSQRQLALWDARMIGDNGYVSMETIDNSAGLLMPFYDADTKILFVAGKGDGNMRYWEFAEGSLHFLSEYQSPSTQKGMGMMCKRGVNVMKNEIDLFFKVCTTWIEQISFRVPRKSDFFQSDIFPRTVANVPCCSSDEYFEGKKLLSPMWSLFDEQSSCWVLQNTSENGSGTKENRGGASQLREKNLENSSYNATVNTSITTLKSIDDEINNELQETLSNTTAFVGNEKKISSSGSGTKEVISPRERRNSVNELSKPLPSSITKRESFSSTSLTSDKKASTKSSRDFSSGKPSSPKELYISKSGSNAKILPSASPSMSSSSVGKSNDLKSSTSPATRSAAIRTTTTNPSTKTVSPRIVTATVTKLSPALSKASSLTASSKPSSLESSKTSIAKPPNATKETIVRSPKLMEIGKTFSQDSPRLFSHSNAANTSSPSISSSHNSPYYSSTENNSHVSLKCPLQPCESCKYHIDQLVLELESLKSRISALESNHSKT